MKTLEEVLRTGISYGDVYLLDKKGDMYEVYENQISPINADDWEDVKEFDQEVGGDGSITIDDHLYEVFIHRSNF